MAIQRQPDSAEPQLGGRTSQVRQSGAAVRSGGRRQLRLAGLSNTRKLSGTVPFVLTDHGTGSEFDGHRRSVLLRSPFWKLSLWEKPVLRFVRAGWCGLRLWYATVTDSRSGPVITYGHEHGFFFALLQLLFSPFIRRRTHLMFDLLLSTPRSGLAGLVERCKSAIFRAAIDGAVVWGKADVRRFAEGHRLPRERLHFHHYHTTMRGFTYTIEDKGYIFAGGNGARDYRTVIHALAQIDFPVKIATTNPDVAAMAVPYPHITVKGVTPAEFRTLLAGCHLFVEAHDPAFFRTSGHQTFLNAMFCGKPVVLADLASADGYITDDQDGLIVPAADVDALRRAVATLLSDHAQRNRLAAAALARAGQASFTIPATMQSIYNLALSIDATRHTPGLPTPVIQRF